jgi:ATP-dependent Clp protease, protease subunit
VSSDVQIPGLTDPATQTVYFSYSAEFDIKTTESFIAMMANLCNEGVRHVYLMLSSPGGLVMNGMNVYNFLRALPIELTTHNVGNVDSIGNAVFLAGTKRYACANSTFMFHGVAFQMEGVQQFDEKRLREHLAAVQADQKRIGSIIEERTKLSHGAVETLFLEASTKDAAYAVGCGIVDEIRDVQIPAGAPIVSLVFQR